MPGTQFHDNRQQEPLALHCLITAQAKVTFKKNALVRHMLIDNPEPGGIGGHNEAMLHLTERNEIRGKFAGAPRLGQSDSFA